MAGLAMRRAAPACRRRSQVWDAVPVLEREWQISATAAFAGRRAGASRNVTAVASRGCCPSARTRSVETLRGFLHPNPALGAAERGDKSLPTHLLREPGTVGSEVLPGRALWQEAGSWCGVRRAVEG